MFLPGGVHQMAPAKVEVRFLFPLATYTEVVHWTEAKRWQHRETARCVCLLQQATEIQGLMFLAGNDESRRFVLEVTRSFARHVK